MKLSKALKLKNKLAGEIALAQRLINESNVTEADNLPAHDVGALFRRLSETQKRLVALKTKIAVANAPIWDAIYEMAECKSQIAFLRAVPVKDGKHLVEGRYGSESTERTYRATLKPIWIEQQAGALTARIEELQDVVDEHNARTEIDFNG